MLKRSAKNQNFSIIRCFSWILFVTTACLYQPGSSPLACTPVERPPTRVFCGFHSSHIRHLGFVMRAKGFFSSRHQYYSNATSTFQQTRLLTSGDVSPNPGPITRSQSARLKSASECLYPHLRSELSTLKGLKLGHLNCNGLLGKIIEVKALLFAVKFDILAISETHLRSSIKDSSIFIPGYKIARRDRSDGRKGGGSLIYYAEDLNAYERKDLSDKSPIEAAWAPRLFTIFTNDLPSCLESCNSSNMEMFADDSTAFVIGDCVDSIVVHINKALQLLHDWAQLNCMSIHPTKTEIMFISKSPFIGPIPPITLDNHLINCTSQSTILGVALDNKLCWKPHIKQISANFNAKINKLKQIKSFDLSTLETIYFKGILPSTTYCISLWGSSSSLQALEESHIRAARLIHNLSPSLPKHEILSKVKWHSLSYFYKKDWRVLPTKLILI